jgi:hypothetical protein
MDIRWTKSGCLAILFAAALAAEGPTAKAGKPTTPRRSSVRASLTLYNTPGYRLRTDLPREKAQEAAVRLYLVGRVYEQWMKPFGRPIQKHFTCYLLSNKPAYNALVGEKYERTFGLCRKGTLYVCLDPPHWELVQHEAFHQFQHSAIGPKTPIWANEGLAEYWQHAEWIGDGFLPGALPWIRTAWVLARFRSKDFKPLTTLFRLSPKQWLETYTHDDYHQVWALTHYLLQAEGGKYRETFFTYLRSCNGAAGPQQALKTFRKALPNLETDYRAWWLALPARSAGSREAKIALARLGSFLVRAHRDGTIFPTPDAMFAAARAGKLYRNFAKDRYLYLPNWLLDDATRWARHAKGSWTLTSEKRGGTIQWTAPDGKIVRATYRRPSAGRPTVEIVTEPAPKSNPPVQTQPDTPPAS